MSYTSRCFLKGEKLMDEIFRYTLSDAYGMDITQEIRILDAKQNNVVVIDASGNEEEYSLDYGDIELIKSMIQDYSEIFEIERLDTPPVLDGVTNEIVVYNEGEAHTIKTENLGYWDLEEPVSSELHSILEVIYTISGTLDEYGIELFLE